ncbi:MAG: amidohydrolase [Chloroflexi bacterium]|nr:amidohydrolase [Chloroflexota bacterium]
MIRRPRVIDWHTHFLPHKFIEAYRTTPRARSTSWLWESPSFSDPELHIKMMDDAGVDMELLGASTAVIDGIKTAGIDLEEGIRFTNNEFAKVAREYPGRFIGSVAIDPFNMKFSLAEIERCVTQLDFRAISMLVCYDSLYVDDEQFWPIFRMAEELEIPIFAHPASTTPYWREVQRADKDYLRSEIAMLLSSTICIGRFVIFGIYDRFPKLNIVFGQLGGFIPLMFGRFDLVYNYHTQWPPGVVRDEAVFPPRLARDYKGRIMGETHSTDYQAIECAVETLGADCVLLGSDYPIAPDSFGIRWTLGQIDKMRISEVNRRKILCGNAARLLKLD